MGIIETIRQHIAVSSGNFAALFKDVEIPPLPAATTSFISEFNKPEPDIRRLAKIITADVELAAKVMRTANSPLYRLSTRVKSIQHAITMLGIHSIGTIVLSYTMKSSVPKPAGDLFDQEAFWTDSLVRALLARSLTRRYLTCQEDEAFTAMLLSDVALPVLLCVWAKYYAPVVEQWKRGAERLSQIERKDFGWDHAQASAWVLKSWDISDEIVCLVGSHNLPVSEIRQLGLERDIALPVATASMLPSMLRPSDERARLFVETMCDVFSMTERGVVELISEIRTNLDEIREQFDLRDRTRHNVLEDVVSIVDSR